MSPEIRERLAMLRESFMHAPGMQDWLSNWWQGLRLDDRRLLLALVGLEDGEAEARRPWKQHPEAHRDKIIGECKRVGRLLEQLRWA